MDLDVALVEIVAWDPSKARGGDVLPVPRAQLLSRSHCILYSSRPDMEHAFTRYEKQGVLP